MKRKLIFVLPLLLVGNIVSAQVLRPMTPRYNNPSVRGNIVYVANNIITSSGGTTSEVPPTGSGVNNGRVGVNIDIDGIPPTTFFTFGANWKYLSR